MDLKSLSPQEITVLPALAQYRTVTDIVKATMLPEVQVLRSLQWLANKGLTTITESKKKAIVLDSNGEIYKKEGLPEVRFLKATTDAFQPVQTIAKKANISAEEINIVIGTLKRKVAIDINKDADLSAKITAQGKKLIEKPTLEEVFLKKTFPLDEKNLTPEELFALKNLQSRRAILKVEEIKEITTDITPEGKEVIIQLKSFDSNKMRDQITPEMLKDGSWKKYEYRYFDVESGVPKIYGGKRHFVNQAIEYMKQIWIELGFEEMSGTFCQTAFWDLDALFVPQDHPARQMQDSFFIADHANPKKILKGTIQDTKVVKLIKGVHETGGDTGSTGWGGTWSPEFASEIMLRTHTTTLSAHYIRDKLTRDAQGKIIPRKFFSVNKVFRNETPDWKHLFEFNQVEGIVVDPDANFQHLLGYLKLFFKKMGFADVRIKPSHFPYTEPSAEVEVFNQRKGEWVELGGSGIFRPEVTKTLIGEEVPVLAWGLGMERIIVEYFDLHDLRDLYKNDIKQLREMKSWMKVSE